jgi:hypothetical protein
MVLQQYNKHTMQQGNEKIQNSTQEVPTTSDLTFI